MATFESEKSKWDEFSLLFQKNHEPSTMITAYSMLSMLKLNQASKVLEVGCGAGGAATLAQRMMPKDAELHLLDLSPQMLQLAQQRVPAVKSIQVGNIEDLPFQPETFDRVYGNYVLHLTPDPDKALREARKVLTKGGLAAFSVWGRPENSPKFTLPEQARAAINLPIRTPPPFHLHDIQNLKDKFKNAGFSKVLAWYHPEPFIVHSAEEYVHISIFERPQTEKEFKSWSEEDQEKYKKALYEAASRVLENGPIMAESLIVIGWV